MVKEQQTPLSPEGTTDVLSGSACFPGQRKPAVEASQVTEEHVMRSIAAL